MSEERTYGFPQNHPYIKATPKPNITSIRPSRSDTELNKQQKHSTVMNAEYLMERIEDLQQQLSTLANAINQQGKDGHNYYQQICHQNEQLRQIIAQKELKQTELELILHDKNQENTLLNESLMKQNEEMEQLHKNLQEQRLKASRISNSQVNTAQFQQKITELNNQISNLLVKIEELVNQNNDQQTNFEQLMKNLNNQNQTIESLRLEIEKFQQHNKLLVDENEYLKQEIRHVEELSINQQRSTQDKYLNQLQDAHTQLQQMKMAVQKQQRQGKIGQIRSNSDRQDKMLAIQKDNNSKLRNQINELNEELIQKKEIERSLRKKYEDKINQYQQDINSLNEEMNKLKIKVRKGESACSQYQFRIEQNQKEKGRLQIYKNSYIDLEQCRDIIMRLQKEKQELTRKMAKKDGLLERERQRKEDVIMRQEQDVALQSFQAKYNQLKYSLQQSEGKLVDARKEIRRLNQVKAQNQNDYEQLTKDYQIILTEIQSMENRISVNQSQLARHKKIYEDLVKKYYETTNLYTDLEKTVRNLQGQRLQSVRLQKTVNNKPHSNRDYDKENTELIKLENSTLNQEINQLRRENQTLKVQVQANREIDISYRGSKQNKRSVLEQKSNSQYQRMRDREIQKLKQRQKELYQQLDKMHKKYVDQQQRNQYGAVNQQKVTSLEDQLSRVNKMLNQKMKELDQAKIHEEELSKELNAGYQRYTQQFNAYGIRHHPEVKRLQAQIITLQRRLMESELEFKQRIGQYDDQLKTNKVQNQHHRSKIQQLMQQIIKERNNIDYNKLTRKLQLSQLKIKETLSELEYKQTMINELTEQVKKLQGKERDNIQNRILVEQIKSLKQNNKALLLRVERYQQAMNKLVEFLNSYESSPAYSADPVDRVIDLIKYFDKLGNRDSMITNNGAKNIESVYHAQRASSESQETNQNMKFSRYEQLARQKQEIRMQFQQTQQYLKRSTGSEKSYETAKMEKQGSKLKQERNGILDRLRRQLAS